MLFHEKSLYEMAIKKPFLLFSISSPRPASNPWIMRFPKWQLRHIRKQYAANTPRVTAALLANPRTLEAGPLHSAPMSFAAPYIESEQVAAMVREKAAGKDYLVVDVRDDDFEVGSPGGPRVSHPKPLNTPVLEKRSPNLIITLSYTRESKDPKEQTKT